MSDAVSPSQQIIRDANRMGETQDSLGRKIRYRRLQALDRARLFKAIGPDNSTVAPYVGMAMIASSATFVDDVPLPFPTNDGLIEASIARLGDEGLAAVASALARDQVMNELGNAATAGAEASTQANGAAADKATA